MICYTGGMSVFIKDLEAGNEILASMRTGYALLKLRDVRGKLYSRVPSRGRVAKSWDIANLAGRIISNDTENCTLHIQFGQYNSRGLLIEQINGEYLVAEVPYWAFGQIRLLSPISYAPRPASTQFPTFGKLRGTEPKAYRTLTRVISPFNCNSTIQVVEFLATEAGDPLLTEMGDNLIP